MIRTTLCFQWSQVHRIPINVFYYYYFHPYNLLFVCLDCEYLYSSYRQRKAIQKPFWTYSHTDLLTLQTSGLAPSCLFEETCSSFCVLGDGKTTSAALNFIAASKKKRQQCSLAFGSPVEPPCRSLPSPCSQTQRRSRTWLSPSSVLNMVWRFPCRQRRRLPRPAAPPDLRGSPAGTWTFGLPCWCWRWLELWLCCCCTDCCRCDTGVCGQRLAQESRTQQTTATSTEHQFSVSACVHGATAAILVGGKSHLLCLSGPLTIRF